MGDTIVHEVMWVSFLLAHIIQIFSCIRSQVFGLSEVCQRGKNSSAPLQPVVVEEPFQQWGLDVIGEFFLHSSKQHRYILTTTYYFMWWIEFFLLEQVNDQEVINFSSRISLPGLTF